MYSLLEDEEFNILVEATKNREIIQRSDSRRLSELQMKYQFKVKRKLKVVSGKVENCLLVSLLSNTNNYVIFPRQGEVANIIAHFYTTYKGEGAQKLSCRINDNFAGISRRDIQTYINNNRRHFIKNPTFKNKAPLIPVVSHTINSRFQIDLIIF